MNGTQHKLKISRENLEQIIKLNPYPIYIWKKVENNFILIDYNNAAEEITEGKIKDFLEITALKFYEEQPNLQEDLNLCFNEKKKLFREIKDTFVTTGKEKDLYVIYYFVPPDLVLVHTEDITERKRAEQKLKESEESLKIILNKAVPPFAIIDFEGSILMVNDSALKFTNYSREEVLQMNVTNIALEITPMDHKKKIWEKLDFGEQIEVLGTQKRKDGSIFPTETTLVKFKLKDQPVIAAFFRDITKRNEAEQKLKVSEEMYRLISENANDIISIVNSEGKYVYCNEAFKRILGYPPEEIIGILMYELIHPEDIDNAYQDFKKIIQTGLIKNELRVRCKDSSYKWLESITRGIYDENNNLTKLIGISRDITERKEAEKKLKESEEKFSKAFYNNSSIMAISSLEEGRFLEVNESFLTTLGFRKEEVIGKTSLELNLWIDREVRDWVRQTSKEKWHIANIEVDIRKKNGETIHGLFSADVIEIEEKPFLITILKDITDRRYAELRLKESEKKYRKAYNQAEFYKDLFAHDMNNILQIISSSNQLAFTYLNDIEKRKKTEEMLILIDKQVERGANLIERIQKLSQLEETKIITQPIEVFAVLSKERDLILERVHDKEITIEIDNPFGKIVVQGNELFKDIIENILNNAIKHNNKPKVEILIKISKEQINGINYYKMEFIDNGRGISNEMKDSIFKRAYRKEQGGGGMGLGLSLVKKIIKSYNGFIWVEERVQGAPSKGSNFVLLIPEGE